MSSQEDEELDLSGDLGPNLLGGGRSSSSSSSSAAAAEAAAVDLPTFGAWTDPVQRIEFWNSVCRELLKDGQVTKDAAMGVIRRIATEHRLFSIPTGKMEKTTAAVYSKFFDYIRSPAKSLPQIAKEVFSKLGGEAGCEMAERPTSVWTVHNMPELHAKIKEVEAAGRKLEADKAKREEEHAAQVAQFKKLKAAAAAASKAEGAAMTANVKEKLDLDATLLRLSKQLQEDAASGGGAGGGGGGVSGSKRSASTAAASSPGKKAKSLAQLLGLMRQSLAGLKALEQLEGTEANGAAALKDDKATGKPLSVDELQDVMVPKHFDVVKTDFLNDLIRYNVVTQLDEEEEEVDED
jgi:hypothetical protein